MGAQEVIQELMRQAGAAALAQDDGAIAVQRKTLGRIDERQLRRGIDGLLRAYLNAEVRDQLVAGDVLAAQLWSTTAQQRLLGDGLAFGAGQLRGIGGAER